MAGRAAGLATVRACALDPPRWTQAGLTQAGRGWWQWVEAWGRGQLQRCELCRCWEPRPRAWRVGQRFCDQACGEFANRFERERFYVQHEAHGLRQVRLPWHLLPWWDWPAVWYWAWRRWGVVDSRLTQAVPVWRLEWVGHWQVTGRLWWYDPWRWRVPARLAAWWQGRQAWWQARQRRRVMGTRPEPAGGREEPVEAWAETGWALDFADELDALCQEALRRARTADPEMPLPDILHALMASWVGWLTATLREAFDEDEMSMQDVLVWVCEMQTRFSATLGHCLAAPYRTDDEDDEDDKE